MTYPDSSVCILPNGLAVEPPPRMGTGTDVGAPIPPPPRRGIAIRPNGIGEAVAAFWAAHVNLDACCLVDRGGAYHEPDPVGPSRLEVVLQTSGFGRTTFGQRLATGPLGSVSFRFGLEAFFPQYRLPSSGSSSGPRAKMEMNDS